MEKTQENHRKIDFNGLKLGFQCDFMGNAMKMEVYSWENQL